MSQKYKNVGNSQFLGSEYLDIMIKSIKIHDLSKTICRFCCFL